jgi:predicted nucleic acid-binding protein
MIVVDTGPLVAVLGADDRHHVESRATLEPATVPLNVPVTVVVEVCQMAERSKRTIGRSTLERQ